MARKAKKARAGDGCLFRNSKGGTWFLRVRGKTRSTCTADFSKAMEKKASLIAELSDGTQAPGAAPVTVKEIITDYLGYLKEKNAAHVEKIFIKHFSHWYERPADTIKTAELLRYSNARAKASAMPATIANELGYLRSAFVRAKKMEKLAHVAFFPIPRFKNARSGFLELRDYGAVLEKLCDSLKPLFVLGYHSGCRKGELVSLEWWQVNFEKGYIQLEKIQTKTDEGRVLPIYGDMREWLEKQKAVRDAECPETKLVLFWHSADSTSATKGGRELGNFYEQWRLGVTLAGHQGLLLHDLRRSAVRNMVTLCGLSESRAMRISGHRTRAML